MRLILTRHGETEENIKGIVQGQLQGKLTENGIKQAEKLALRLKNEKIDFIYSSDLTRAANTAKEIHKYHKNIPFIITKELRERNFGEFQGKTKKEVGWEGKRIITEKEEPKKGAETRNQIYERAEKLLHKTIKKHKKDTILFVGHNGINKAIIGVITGKKYPEIFQIEHLHNTSVSIFEIDEDKNHKIHLFNCIEHLN